MGILPTPLLIETVGFKHLGHLEWTICSSLSRLCSDIFPTFSLSYWGAHSYYPRGPIMGKGKCHTSRKEWDSGFWVPWAFKLDHLHPFQPILFWQFSNFFTFILGSPFLLPQRANNGKREFSQLQNWMIEWIFSACSIHIGTFALL